MANVTIEHKSNVHDQKKISHRIFYPDGIERILTMKRYQWDWVSKLEQNNMPFNETLVAAIELSEEFPSEKGYNFDVLENTTFMLLIGMKLIHEEKAPKSNDR